MTEDLLLENWIRRYGQIVARNQDLLKNFSALLDALNARGIEILPLKGMDLLLRGCSTLGGRSLSDIDILVREKDLPRLVGFLKAAGFSPCRAGSLSLDYVSSEGSFILDIIWKIGYMDSGTLWDRARFRETPRGTYRLLHPNDALIYLVGYTVTWRGYFSPFFLQDLRGLLQKEGSQVDWGQWVSEVRRAGMVGAIFCGLTYARQKGLKEIPGEVYAALEPRSVSERFLAGYYSRVTKEGGNFSPSYLRVFFGTPGWREKFELLRDAFSPSIFFIMFRRSKEFGLIYFLVGIFWPFRIIIRSFYIVPRDLIRLFRK